MKTLFKYISSIFFSICLVLFFVVMILFARELRDVPDITQANLQDPLSSEIYDKNLNLIATVGAEKREYVSLEDIPKNITDAVLSTEDTRFYSHLGIDPIRLIKAVLVNIRSNSAQQGASTITQQVVKNSLLTSDKSLQRKIQEAYLSLKLENKYSKKDILEMYMNKIYYSDGQYGVKTAAKYFYNKELDQLTLPQVALLTGIPQQPILYNPYDYPEQAKERRDTVLYALLSNGKISEDEYNSAISTPITEGIVSKTKEERANQHTYNPKFAAYIDQITKELKENKNFENVKDPLSMGIKIYTNLNPELQMYVQDMLDNQSYPMTPHASQAAISVLDTKTGLVEAIGGGKNYKAGGYNFAVDARVQPGSSIKPLIDYAPGIEYYGWDPQTTFSDTPYKIAGTEFYIQNWDRIYHGTVSMTRAVSWSYNIPAVRAFESVGYERAKLFAERLGIPVTKDEPTTAIGGNVDGVSTLQMAGAFASFGNKGYYNKPSTIVKVFNANGKELVNIKYGKNQRDVENPNGKYPIYGTGGLMSYADKYLYDKPSVLIGRKGSISKVRFSDKPFWTVDTLFYTEVNESKVIPKYLYYKMLTMDMSEYNEGTTIPSLRTDTLYRIELDIPDKETQKKVIKVLDSLDKKIELNNEINNNLCYIT